mmetsp:Transcript_40734/g.85579  ORF Transcript_40734/g.85579 Transcript_40734/m.85579 type:complete len:110 (+) Transcript_40734:851-1180(+)
MIFFLQSRFVRPNNADECGDAYWRTVVKMSSCTEPSISQLGIKIEVPSICSGLEPTDRQSQERSRVGRMKRSGYSRRRACSLTIDLLDCAGMLRWGVGVRRVSACIHGK